MYFATFYGPKCIYDVVANTFTAWHIAAYIQAGTIQPVPDTSHVKASKM